MSNSPEPKPARWPDRGHPDRGDLAVGFAGWAAVAGVLVLALLPVVWVFAAALGHPGGQTAAVWADVLASRRCWRLLGRTIGLAALAALGGTAVGAAVGGSLARTAMPARRLLLPLLFLPVAVPPYIQAMAWLDLLGRNGWLNRTLMRLLGLERVPLDLCTLPGCAFVLACCLFPIVALTTAHALATADRQAEAAAELFVGKARAFWGVTLRSVLPALAVGALMVFAVVLGEFGVASLLQVNVYTLEIYSRFNAFHDIAGATAASVPLAVAGLAPLLLAGLFLGRRVEGRVAPCTSPAQTGALPWLGFAFCLGTVAVTLVLPLGTLVAQAGHPSSYWRAALSASEQIGHSLAASAGTATLAVALVFIGLAVVRRQATWVPPAVGGATLVPFVLPGTVLAIGLIQLCNRPGPLGWVYGSAGIVVVACAGKLLAVAFWPLASALSRVGSDLEDAGAVHGLSRPRVLAGITARLCLPVLVAVWLLVFALSVAELHACVLVCPPGFATLGVRLFTLLHYGMNQLVAALAVLLLGLVLVPALAAYAVLRPGVEEWYARGQG